MKFDDIANDVLNESKETIAEGYSNQYSKDLIKMIKQVDSMVDSLISRLANLEDQLTQETGVGGFKVDKSVKAEMDEVERSIGILEKLSDQISYARSEVKYLNL